MFPILRRPPVTELGIVIFTLQLLMVVLIPVLDDGGKILPMPYAAAFLTVCSLRVVRAPARFSVPLFPVTPALGVFFTVHLVCSLGWPAYVRFAVWMGIGGAVYGLYSARAAEQHEGEVKRQRQESRREQQLAERAMPRSLEPERPQGLAAEAGGGERGWLLNGAAAN